MKKLITAIAAIATSFGLFAADAFTTSVTNDIQFKEVGLPIVGYNSEGTDSLTNTTVMPVVHWFADTLKTNFNDKIDGYEQPELKESDTVPSYKYLAIDTDVKEPVLRTFSAVSLAETNPRSYQYDNIAISDHGVFIDTETTFTLFDTVPESPSDSKILVWARETEADEDAGIAGATNLMVTCGVEIDKKFLPTNYVLAVDGIVPEQMYRLTIRADKEKDSENTIFRVYLDGEQLKTVPLEDGTTLEVFPSLVGGNQQLGAAGFGGTGSLKSVDLLTEMDAEDKVDFAADDTYLAVSWNKGVTGFTVDQIGRDPQVIVVTGSGTTNLLVHSGEATVTPTYLTNPKYKFDSFAASGTLTLNDDTEGIATVTIERYAGHNGQNVGTLAINAIQDRKGASLLIVHGDGTEEDIGVKPYLTDVMAYIWGRMTKNSSGEPTPDTDELGVSDTLYITLVNDEVSTNFDFTVHGNYTEYIYSAVVLDLNGHSVSNTVDTQCASVFDNWTDFTIQDTSVTGGGMIVAQEGQDVIANNYSLTIKAAENADNPIRIRGPIYIDDYAESTKIEGGLFTVPVEGDNVTLPDLKKWSATPTTDDYYSLVDAGAKTVTITTNPAIGEFNVLTNGEPVVVTGNTATIGELDPFTVTFSKAAHYNLDDTTGWDYDSDLEVYSKEFEATETAVTLPTGTAITFDVTFADGENSTITPAAGVSNLVEGTVVAVTATAATGYEFAAAEYEGWTKEQNGTLTQSYEVTAEDTVTAPDATAIPYAITYKDGDSTLDLSPKTYTIAAAVDLPALPAKAGYTAAGWYGNAQFEGDTITTIAAGETGAKTFYVKYTADTYKYTFAKADSEVGEPIAPIEYTIEAPATITAPACTWTLADHEFAGWTNTVKGGSVIAAGATLEKVLENTELTATWVSTAAPEPTPDDPTAGDITKDDDGNYVITPKADGAVIDVKNAGDNNFIVDVPTDCTIKGVAAGKIKVMCNGEDITSVCKGGNAEGFSTELDPTQTTPELIEATATEQPLVVGTTVDLKIKQSVPGLAYKLLRVGDVGDFSDSTKITTAATMKGDGETLTLTDANKPANKAFYTVAVGKDVIND